jgi:hypothetical protein
MAKLGQPNSMPRGNTEEQSTSSNSPLRYDNLHITPPLHPISTDQTPVMPPSARQTMQCRRGSTFQSTFSPDACKSTPMTVQMTPDYEAADDLLNSVPTKMCMLAEAILDASSTEAADSSKSSEYEVSYDVHRFGCDPSPPPASRTLFSLDVHDANFIVDDDDDDDDDDEDGSGDRNFSDIIIASTTTSYDTPNHSINSSNSPRFERAYSDGISSPYHQHRNGASYFRRLSANMSQQQSPNDSFESMYVKKQPASSTRLQRKHLRSRRSLRVELSPALDKVGISNKKNRAQKSRSIAPNSMDCPLEVVQLVNDEYYCRDDIQQTYLSTDSEEDVFVLEDQPERCSDSSRFRTQHRSSSRRSSLTPTKNQFWRTLSQRMSTTKNLIWLLCFVGLTSVSMIVTLNHQMSRVANIARSDHLSVLFRHSAPYGGRGLVLPPPKIGMLTLPQQTAPTKTRQIRGAVSEVSIATAEPNHKTVSLNTLAQLLPNVRDAKLHKDPADVQGGADGPVEKSDLVTNLHHHHQHRHYYDTHHNGKNHRHDTLPTDKNHHPTHHDDPHHHDPIHHESNPDAVHKHHDTEKNINNHEVVETDATEQHSHHHHHDDPKSTRFYLKPKPAMTGIDGIPRIKMPEIWDEDEVEPAFDTSVSSLYLEGPAAAARPINFRIVFLNGTYFLPKGRLVRRYRSDFTDSTQLYSILDSGDERIASMELRAPYVQGECVPMKEWQTTFNPSCNGMHELDLPGMGDNRSEDDFKLFGMNGFWRNAWRFDSTGGHSSLLERDTVVLKTLRYVVQ